MQIVCCPLDGFILTFYESLCRNGGNISKIEDLLQWVKLWERVNWSKSVQNRKITPTGRKRKASGLGQKCAKPEDYSKRKEEGSKQVGAEAGKTGRLLQEEGIGKQAGWSRSWQNRKIAPSRKKKKEKEG